MGWDGLAKGISLTTKHQIDCAVREGKRVRDVPGLSTLDHVPRRKHLRR